MFGVSKLRITGSFLHLQREREITAMSWIRTSIPVDELLFTQFLVAADVQLGDDLLRASLRIVFAFSICDARAIVLENRRVGISRMSVAYDCGDDVGQFFSVDVSVVRLVPPAKENDERQDAANSSLTYRRRRTAVSRDR